MKKRGFTLMELLIVIAIIAILVSISVVSYSSAQKKARDARRHSDMKALQNAWEQYYADNNGNYPGTTTAAPCTLSLVSNPDTYLPGGLPVDPKSPTPYPQMYSGWSSCSITSYCFCAGLEGEANFKTDCAGNAAAPNPPYIGLDCVRNLQ
jgi:prepilin-type N-terminal cleavage/methylation domain-containing protein